LKPKISMRALLASLRDAPWAAAAVSELRAALLEVADSLASALAHTADAAACEAVVAALWQRAEQGVGWTEPFWRECFVLACVAAAVTLSSSGNHQRALRHLDCAFIMGGPPEVLQPFVAVVEPLVPRAAASEAHMLPRSLPDGAAPEPHPGLALCRLESGEWGRFRKEFYNVDSPCVLAGIGAAWPALEKWRDLSWWAAQFGHRHVPLEVGKHTDGAAWREEVVLLRDFVAELAADQCVLYLAQHQLFEHLPALRADFEVPDCVGRRLTRINAWLGSRGTVTPLHYDRRVTACARLCPFAR
jgi:lysine-specific demethylase 8